MAEDGEYFDDDESDEEEETATDLCGYRHINTVDSIDCYYGTYPADFPILGSFPTYHTEGDGIVQTMRHHLDFAVPKELIQDTYGHVKPVGEILSFNLPKLQARFWCEWPQMAARLTSFEAHEATEAEKMIAGAIASVAGILRGEIPHSAHRLWSTNLARELCLCSARSFSYVVQSSVLPTDPRGVLSTIPTPRDSARTAG
jgi:hypothetical protein